MTDFTEFWSKFPRKVGKLDARRKWDILVRQGYKPVDIIAGIQPYIDNKDDEVDFCHPKTYLHGGRWMDEYESHRLGPDLSKYELGSSDQLRQYRDEFPDKPKGEYVPVDYGKLKVVE